MVFTECSWSYSIVPGNSGQSDASSEDGGENVGSEVTEGCMVTSLPILRSGFGRSSAVSENSDEEALAG